jgi:glutamate-5-semialdehyde dehydrogenase
MSAQKQELPLIEKLGLNAKNASRALARVSTEHKNRALLSIASALETSAGAILIANSKDVAAAKYAGMNAVLLDRLTLDSIRLNAIIQDIKAIVELPDPVGIVFAESTLPNGLKVHKKRVPLGVLGVIYEARPNVTIDVAGLALKSGNAVILRGGTETIHSNLALVDAIQQGLLTSGFPETAVQLISDPDRARVLDLLRAERFVDMIIPRGGAGLHTFCRENSRIPVITGGIGICHLYIDESAEIQKAIEVIRNAKVQRPSVCNALDTTLVHQAVANSVLPALVDRLAADGVTFRAEARALSHLQGASLKSVQLAGEKDFDTEWLSLVLGLKVVDNLQEAIDHIAAHSTGHSDGILTANPENAREFLEQVDSAAVYVNASTRFTDGAQLGLGAEIAISTQRMHARGPMGLEELTTYKWVIQGDYQVRP